VNVITLLRAVLDFANNPGSQTGLALLEVVFEQVVPLIPVDALKGSLDAAGRKRAEMQADVLDAVRFPNG
jgi:hypothetical protein